MTELTGIYQYIRVYIPLMFDIIPVTQLAQLTYCYSMILIIPL